MGTTLPLPLSIQATDAYTHTVIPGVAVTCKDGGALGKLSTTTGTTDSAGKMSTNYSLPVKARVETITCTATGYVSGVFTETSVAGPPTIRVFSGTKQTAPVNTTLTQPLMVRVADIHGNPIQGAAVTFSDGGKGGSLSSATVTTDAAGYGSSSYTTPNATGIVKITGTMAGLPVVTFIETVTAQ